MTRPKKTSSPLKVVQASRRVKAYPVFDSEINSMGTLGLLEQILLNAVFTGIGAFVGSLTAVLTAANNKASTAVLVLFWLSVAITVLALICFVVARRANSRIKDDIRK